MADKLFTRIRIGDEILPPEGLVEHGPEDGDNLLANQTASYEAADMWMMGHSFAQVCFKDAFVQPGDHPFNPFSPLDARNAVDFNRISNELEKKGGLGRLLKKMMSWEAERRPSAEEALKDPVFHQGASSSPPAKRLRLGSFDQQVIVSTP